MSRPSWMRSSRALATCSRVDGGVRCCSCPPPSSRSRSPCGSGLTTSGPRLAATLISSEVIWGLLAAQGLFLVWRLLAVGSSLLDPALPRPGRRDALPIAILLVVMMVPQVYAATYRDGTRSRRRDLRGAAARRGRAVHGAGTGPEQPRPRRRRRRPCRRRRPHPGALLPRIKGLIIGVDSGVGRNTYLTDTMIVVSLDPATEDRLDGLDPARHGRCPAGRRPQVPRQDQRSRLVRPSPPQAVPEIGRDRASTS